MAEKCHDISRSLNTDHSWRVPNGYFTRTITRHARRTGLEFRNAVKEAFVAIRAWIKEVKRSGLDCFDKFLGTLENWMDEITNYFISRLTSGWVEGLNNFSYE